MVIIIAIYAKRRSRQTKNNDEPDLGNYQSYNGILYEIYNNTSDLYHSISLNFEDPDEDDHYDAVYEKRNDHAVTKNPYYEGESEDQINTDDIRQSTFDQAENVKVSENPYYE